MSEGWAGLLVTCPYVMHRFAVAFLSIPMCVFNPLVSLSALSQQGGRCLKGWLDSLHECIPPHPFHLWLEGAVISINISMAYLSASFTPLSLTHSSLEQPKSSDYIGDISLPEKNGRKIFEGELFIKTLSTTLLQIICILVLYSDVIIESINGPDDTCQVDL